MAALRLSLRRLSTAPPAPSLAAAVRAQPQPEQPAVLSPQQAIAWSYGELDKRVRQLARGLREMGVRPPR